MQDGIWSDSAYLRQHKSQITEQSVFHREKVELSELSQTRAVISGRISHLVIHTVSEFSDMRAEVLKKVREEKGQYDYSDVVNACGLSYARFYAEIEERCQNGDKNSREGIRGIGRRILSGKGYLCKFASGK